MPTLQLIHFDKVKLPIVKLIIKNKPYFFLVDTGAVCTSVRPELIPELNHEQQNSIQEILHVGVGFAQATLIRVPFSVAGVSISSIRISTVMDNLSKFSSLHIDGIIGQDILKQFKSVEFDYTRSVVIFKNV